MSVTEKNYYRISSQVLLHPKLGFYTVDRISIALFCLCRNIITRRIICSLNMYFITICQAHG